MKSMTLLLILAISVQVSAQNEKRVFFNLYDMEARYLQNVYDMNSVALDRPYQAERTAEQTPRANGGGICQATLFIFIVVCLF